MRVRYCRLTSHLYLVRSLQAMDGVADGDAKSALSPTVASFPLLPPRSNSRGGDVVLVPQVRVPRGAPSRGALALLVLVGGVLG